MEMPYLHSLHVIILQLENVGTQFVVLFPQHYKILFVLYDYFFFSMYANINQTEQYWNYSGPGGWNDPDMLEIGNGGMSTAEYEAHFSLWCLMKVRTVIIHCSV